MLGLDNPIHIAFLFVLLLLVFGAKRLPELGHSLGAGMRGFKESITGQDVENARLAAEPEPTSPEINR
jgi:sec-independent protein translocase protein TatA